MGPYVHLALYVVTALAFAWLTWRSLWATSSSPSVAPPQRRTRDPILFWGPIAFYTGMAVFEIAVDAGL